MRRSKLIFLPMELISISNFIIAEDNEYVCKELLSLETDLNKTLPQKLDEVTELTQLSVNCDTNTVKYSKRLLVELSLFSEGWVDRKQRQHTQLHCNASGLSSTYGWIAMDVIYDKNFKYLTTLQTEKTDCEK